MNTSMPNFVHNKYFHVILQAVIVVCAVMLPPSVLEQQAAKQPCFASPIGSNYSRASCSKYCQRINNKNKQSDLQNLVIGKRIKLLK